MPRVIDSLKIFSSGYFMGLYTNVIISTPQPLLPGALILLNNLNASSNSFLLDTASCFTYIYMYIYIYIYATLTFIYNHNLKM